MTLIEMSGDHGKTWFAFDPSKGQTKDAGIWLRFPAESGSLEAIYAVILTGETRIEKISEAVGLPEWCLDQILLTDDETEITGDYRRLQDAYAYARGVSEYLKVNDVVLDLSDDAEREPQ